MLGGRRFAKAGTSLFFARSYKAAASLAAKPLAPLTNSLGTFGRMQTRGRRPEGVSRNGQVSRAQTKSDVVSVRQRRSRAVVVGWSRYRRDAKFQCPKCPSEPTGSSGSCVSVQRCSSVWRDTVLPMRRENASSLLNSDTGRRNPLLYLRQWYCNATTGLINSRVGTL